MMRTQIPSGLQALMQSTNMLQQASQALQQQAQPVVQTPLGPQPTVAGRVEQGLQTLAAQSAPGVQQAGQQAGLAAQIMARRQAQRQQLAQNPQAVAQMAAQMMQAQQPQPQPQQDVAQSGIAAAAPNTQYYDGGIVSFEAGGRKEDKKPSLYDLSRDPLIPMLKEWWDAISSRADIGSRALMGAGESRVPITTLEEPPLINPETGKPYTLEAPSAPAAPPAAVAPPVVQPPVVRPPVAPAAGPAGGIAAATPPMQGAPQLPTGEAVEQMQRIIVPRGEVDTAIETRRRLEEERAKAKAGMPNLYEEGIAALREASAQRQEMLKRQQEQDLMNRTHAFFRSLYTRGEEPMEMEKAIRTRDEAARVATLTEKQAMLKLREAEQADRLGDTDRKIAAEKDIQGMVEKLASSRTTAGTAALQSLTHIFGSQMQAGSAMYNADMHYKAAMAQVRLANERGDRADKAMAEKTLRDVQAGLLQQINKLSGSFRKEDREERTRYEQQLDDVRKELAKMSGAELPTMAKTPLPPANRPDLSSFQR